MIREVKFYQCEGGHPSDDEIKVALDIVRGQPFIIELRWFRKYSGWHRTLICKDDTLDSVKERLPRIYGM